MTFKDFCPLCGYRFEGGTSDEVYDQILQHINNGECEKNWVTLIEAITDDGIGPGKGLYKPTEVKPDG